MKTAEQLRLEEEARREKNWKRWGPYLSERQWGTVREDYSANGDAWGYLPHDHARSRAYRWGEDGLLGFADRECRLCFAPALWNGRDPILKERLFGLTGHEGNHGEDVKEAYFYLDSTPTHSYARALYKYPHGRFPYEALVETNRARGLLDPEFELADTGLFDEGRYFDVFIEYAKAAPDDLLIRIRAINRGPDPAEIHLIPTLWFRNTWIWGCRHEGCSLKPRIDLDGELAAQTRHDTLEPFRFEIDPATPDPVWLFTENETNTRRLFGVENYTPYTKDAFHRRIIDGDISAVNPAPHGTKCASWTRHTLEPGEEAIRHLRLRIAEGAEPAAFGEPFDQVLEARRQEADAFHAAVQPAGLDDESRSIIRQAHAGLLWSKQFYHLIVEDWIAGDASMPPPPASRKTGRNHEWPHLYSRDVISMPDKWEYPWFAAWDLAFHMIPFAEIDPHYAKAQITLFLREWYMHPNGQIPAYEWNFSDVNPPVHAWAAWRIYQMSSDAGEPDRVFLESAFQKLLLNFTWWVNRKDARGRNLFSGGFLGLDNIGVFDRSSPLPTGGFLEQADGTAWMAFYAGTMLAIALELARENPAYEDMASKFFEHYIQIADAMNHLGGSGLWDEEDGFYYDMLKNDRYERPLKTRSMVGLLPLITAELLVETDIRKLPGFYKRLTWFVKNRPDLSRLIAHCETSSCPAVGSSLRLLAIPSRDRLERLLRYLFDEREFLSPYGIRSLSKYHEEHPFTIAADGREYRVQYVPGEGDSHLFGGNSNWRGPVWLPINHLIVEALKRYHRFYGSTLTVEFPTGSGHRVDLREAARLLSARLASPFLPGSDGRRPCHGSDSRYASDPHWRSLVLFHEYFHAETGRGLGASHQTGWTALVTRHIEATARLGHAG